MVRLLPKWNNRNPALGRGFFREAILIVKLAKIGLVAGLIGFAVFWWLTQPNWLSEDIMAGMPAGDASLGEQVFWAGGCGSCHAAPKAEGEAKLLLTGGHEFVTPFGTFRAPNLSPDEVEGIGRWSKADFANAMLKGVSPTGQHYYPAFPFTSYSRMTPNDVANLWAYMQTLPKSSNKVADHDVGFPFNIRRGLGLWKLLYLDTEFVEQVGSDEQLRRGRYLVEALAHCGECHTPRNLIGGMDRSRWMAGGVAPDGKERIPNITPHKNGIGDWSASDIVNAFETGFTPEYDSFGSSMVDVQINMTKLKKSDLEAIAAYLKNLRPIGKEN